MMIKIDKRFELNDGVKSVLLNELTHTGVLVNHSLLESIYKEFETQDDTYWFFGKGKVEYLDFLTRFLKKENSFFKKSQKNINKRRDRYFDFCNQNVIHAVLTSIIHEKPLTFLHPESYENSKDQMVGIFPDFEPDYVPELDSGSSVFIH